MPAFIDIAGRQFSSWSVKHRVDSGTQTKYRCVCECGTERDVLSQSLLRGKSLNCGCKRVEALIARQTIHGASKRGDSTGTYETWKHMRGRCLNPEHQDYGYYGGRGIKICDRWSSFAAFVNDMGERPDGLTIERNDVDGDYEPSNCHWATRMEQTHNRRPFTPPERRGEQVGNAKLTEDAVRTIRSIQDGTPQREIAELFGVTQTLISQVKSRKIWAHVK